MNSQTTVGELSSHLRETLARSDTNLRQNLSDTVVYY